MKRTDLLLLLASIASIASTDPAIDSPAYLLDQTHENFPTLTLSPDQPTSQTIQITSPRTDATPELFLEFYDKVPTAPPDTAPPDTAPPDSTPDTAPTDTAPQLPTQINLTLSNHNNDIYTATILPPNTNSVISLSDIMAGCREPTAFFQATPGSKCTVEITFSFQALEEPQQVYWGAILSERREWDDCDEDEIAPADCTTLAPSPDLSISLVETQ